MHMQFVIQLNCMNEFMLFVGQYDISWSSDFVLYLQHYLMDLHHALI